MSLVEKYVQQQREQVKEGNNRRSSVYTMINELCLCRPTKVLWLRLRRVYRVTGASDVHMVSFPYIISPNKNIHTVVCIELKPVSVVRSLISLPSDTRHFMLQL